MKCNGMPANSPVGIKWHSPWRVGRGYRLRPDRRGCARSLVQMSEQSLEAGNARADQKQQICKAVGKAWETTFLHHVSSLPINSIITPSRA